MNRRESFKIIGLGTVSAGLLLEACDTKPKKDTEAEATRKDADADRQEIEIERDKRLQDATFFNAHEMSTITVLGDIIIPKDEISGSASDAKVPEFIEFIVKDMPDHQVPMRGGLRWLDMQCLKRYGHAFVECKTAEQLEIINEIAFPDKAKPEMQPGVAFFDRMRSLTASGFFTSKMGMDDLGYVGNRPHKWQGVPAEVLKQYGLEDVDFVRNKS